MTEKCGRSMIESQQEFAALALQDVPNARIDESKLDARTIGQRFSITLERLSALGYTPKQCLKLSN